jgi:hypothetical protein
LKLPLGFGYSTLAELAADVRKLATSISAGWNVEHNPDGTHGEISVTGLTFDGETQTTVGAAGGATALPATPTGYLVVTIDGTEYVVPYYAKS